MTREEVKRVLRYEPETGTFVWLVGVGKRIRPGCVAGYKTKTPSGEYRKIGLFGKQIAAHRLAWFYMNGCWPSMDIDHKDGDGLNNAWSNLRTATRSQNLANAKRRESNKAGHKGVYPCNGRFRAAIRVQGRRIYLGTFDTPEQAHGAYLLAAQTHFGEFARA
jgi:hypothetical protein